MCAPVRWPALKSLGAGTVIPKVWRSPVAKIDADEAEWLLALADKARPKVRDAFLRAVEMVRGTPKESALRAALESGSVEQVMLVLNIQAGMETALQAEMIPVIEDLFIAVGRAAPEATIPSQLRSGSLGYRFDISNPNTLTFLRQHGAQLVTGITDETRLAVRGVVVDAFRFGGHPREQARTIRTMVGLTQRSVKAVANYEAALREENRPDDQIARMVERYRQRQLKLRATTIARTETLRASNAGHLAAWNGAADKGLLNRATFRMQWLVTRDDRLCQFCAPIPGMNEGGIALGGKFKTPKGPVDSPPLHPQCRCSVVAEGF